MTDNKKTADRVKALRRELRKHQHLYYVQSAPVISDREYDRLFDELLSLEKKYPQLADPNSPTRRVGSDLTNKFPDYPHPRPVLSLDKAYDTVTLQQWTGKRSAEVNRPLDFVLEEKYDGASIVLYYRDGGLEAAVTRGNGRVGNVVTENIRTIGSIPLQVDFLEFFSVRGEIYISRSDFSRLQDQVSRDYANPRNLAAGTLRNLNSSSAARIPLRMAVYEGNFPDGLVQTHLGSLLKLRDLGFPVDGDRHLFTPGPGYTLEEYEGLPSLTISPLQNMPAVVREKQARRNRLDHEIDGLVLKVNNLEARGEIGRTSHHPKWAVAYKFEAPAAETVVRSIDIQVGRNGRVTPVANLEPVAIAGSTVSRATLHNQEYINLLELNIGDRVEISKRGDIIPAVEKVLEKTSSIAGVYRLPDRCPFCSTGIVQEGAHLFCPNRDCPERKKRQLIHFCRRDGMDIETLGEKTLTFLFDRGFVRDIPDLYEFDFNQLLGYEGFKEKKVQNIIRSLRRSKEQPFERVLLALGFENMGRKVISLLIDHGYDDVDKIIEAARQKDVAGLADIDGIGEHTARLIIRQFSDPVHLARITRLKKLGLEFARRSSPAKKEAQFLEGQRWVITGSFDRFRPRRQAEELIRYHGGQVRDTVSPRTTHVLAGKNPGSKFQRARELDIPILTEEEFLRMIQAGKSERDPGSG